MIRHQANPNSGTNTEEGKTASCLNHWKHGLTGNFGLLHSESREAFNELRDALRAEHAPRTPTEVLLVDRMAEHVWVSQRAQLMQNKAAAKGEDSWFALMLRYQTTNDRAFHRCLAELRAIRRERSQERKRAQEFESQNSKIVANTRLVNARAAETELKTTLKSNLAVRHSGVAPIPFGEVEATLTDAIEQCARNGAKPSDQAAA